MHKFAAKYWLLLLLLSVTSIIANAQTPIADTPVPNRASAVIKPAYCGENNGAVTDLEVTGEGLTYLWTIKGNGIFEYRQKNLVNFDAGTYTLTVTNETGRRGTATFTIPLVKDQKVDITQVKITNADCGQANGSITGVTATGDFPIKYLWLNRNNQVVSQAADLINQPAGTYILNILGGRAGVCSDRSEFIIGNASGLTIDTSRLKIIPDNCRGIGAAITGIKVLSVGNVQYRWTRIPPLGAPQQVSTELDLRYVPSGRYQLTVTDESGCAPIVTRIFVVGQEGSELLFNPDLIKVTKATCESYASITGIEEQQPVTGILHYIWRDSTFNVISEKPTLTGLTGGKYYFQVQSMCDTTKSGAFNDPPYTLLFDLGESRTTFNGVFRYTLRNSCVGQNTGSVTIDAYPPFLQKMRWVNTAGDNVGEGPSITNLGEGNYLLYVTDNFGCERYYDTYFVADLTPVQAVGGDVVTDTCNTRSGGVRNVQLLHGYEPFFYIWRDGSGNVISREASLSGVGAGNYTLAVSDATGCIGPERQFTVDNIDVTPAAPEVNSIYICTGGEATFRVSNPQPGRSYRLYDSPNSFTPIDEQKSGEFKIKVFTNRNFYVSVVHGDCEGPRTEMSVSIGLIIEDVTNTFTPNNDGINDFWLIRNVEKYTDALIQVYDRSGQQVYQSRGYSKPFNGVFRGKMLPSGTYYYVITLDRGCKVTGNVTILR